MLFCNSNKPILRAVSVVLISGLLLSGAGISSYAIADPSDFALAPPSVINPPCFITNGIEFNYEIVNDWRTRTKFLQATDEDKIRDTLKVVDDGLTLAIDVPFFRVHEELITNAYDAAIDRIAYDSSDGIKIKSQLYTDGEDVVLTVTDNGKTVEFGNDGKTPVRRPREFNKHLGGFGSGEGQGIRLIERYVARKGGTVKWYPLKVGTRAEVRIPKRNVDWLIPQLKDKYVVITNDDAIEAWDKETVRSVNAGETLGEFNRNRWAYMEVGILIGQMLILTQDKEHKLHNPKDRLIFLIKKHIRNRKGESEILLEGYDIDGIEEVREGGEITGFSLPVTRNGTPAYKLIYNLQGGDTDIQMKDGTKVYVTSEVIDYDMIINYIKKVATYYKEHEVLTQEQFNLLKQYAHDVGIIFTYNDDVTLFLAHSSTGIVTQGIEAIGVVAELLKNRTDIKELSKETNTFYSFLKNGLISHELGHIAKPFNAFGVACEYFSEENRNYKLEKDVEEWIHRFFILTYISTALVRQDKGVATALTEKIMAETERGSILLKDIVCFLEDNKTKAKENISDLLESVKSGAESVQPIIYLIDKITISARAGTGVIKVSLNDLIRSVISMVLEPYVRNAYFELDMDLDEKVPEVNLTNDIWFIWTNLITNAIDAINQNIKVDKETARKITIKSNYDVQSGKITIMVQDTGIGIAKENIDRIWQKGFTTKETGTGLGLYFVKEIVEKNGGTISVESELGKGTTFTIRLLIAKTTSEVTSATLQEATNARINELHDLRHDILNGFFGFIGAVTVGRKRELTDDRIEKICKQIDVVEAVLNRIPEKGCTKSTLDYYLKELKQTAVETREAVDFEVAQARLGQIMERLPSNWGQNERRTVYDVGIGGLRHSISLLSSYFEETSGIKRKVKLNDILDAATTVRTLIYEHNRKSYNAGDVELVTDDMALMRAIANIAINSQEAMDKEDDIFTITTRLVDDSKTVEIVLSDTGKGISANMLPHIFDRGVTSKMGTGHGLGLTITKECIEKRCGGTIEVDSLTEEEYSGFKLPSSLFEQPTAKDIENINRLYPHIEKHLMAIIDFIEQIEHDQSITPDQLKRFKENISFGDAEKDWHNFVDSSMAMSHMWNNLLDPVMVRIQMFSRNLIRTDDMKEKSVASLTNSKQEIRKMIEVLHRLAEGRRITPGTTFTIRLPISTKSSGKPKEQSEIVEVAEWYGRMYKYVVDNYDRTSTQYTFLSEARNPAEWTKHSELGASLDLDETDYCSKLSRMTIAELVNEYNNLEPEKYIHQDGGKTLLQLERIHFCEHLLGRTMAKITSYDNTLREAPEILKEDPSFRVVALYAKKKLLLFREWAYRHWDGKSKVASHLLFNLDQSTQKLISSTTATSVETEQIQRDHLTDTTSLGQVRLPVAESSDTAIPVSDGTTVWVKVGDVASRQEIETIKRASEGAATSERRIPTVQTAPETQHKTETEQYLKGFHIFLKSTNQKTVIIEKLYAIINGNFDCAKLKREGKILDVGTADGLVLQNIMPHFNCGVSVEPNEKVVAKLREKNIKGLHIVTDFIQDYSPSNGEKYDFILVSHVLYYLKEDERMKQVERMASWLKPGGKLVLIHGANIQADSHDKARMMRMLGSGDTDVESEKIVAHLKMRNYNVTSELLESRVIADMTDMVDILKFLLHTPLPELEPKTPEIRAYIEENLRDEQPGKYRLRIPQDVVVVTANPETGLPSLPAASIVISPQSERIHATNFQDTLTYIQAREDKRAKQANEEPRPTIVALGTSWITGYKEGRYPQHSALNPLLSSMGKRPQFIVGDDKDLLREIKKKMGEKGFENARVIVLAGEETVTKDLTELNNGKNILLGVDNKYLVVDSYVRVMEMLEIASKLALDPDTPPSSPNIPMERRGSFWVFIPKAEPIVRNYEQLKATYKAQEFA